MSNFDSPLNNLKIASPCPANWDAMAGNNRVRYCGECKLNVYNLSGMTRKEAETLLNNSEGRLCVRYYQRADGTVLTQDCPVGWRALKMRVSGMAAAFCTMILGFFTFFVAANGNQTGQLVGKFEAKYTRPTPTPKHDVMPLTGAVAVPVKPTPKPAPKESPKPSPKPGKNSASEAPNEQFLLGRKAVLQDETSKNNS